jgi:hypothetical protein
VANKPSDAVKGYLEALAAGKADAALALTDEQAADKTFLTDAVLADSNSRAPITAINVPEVDDEYAYSIDASYKIGDQAVSDKYSVKKTGSTWKVRDGFADLNLTYARSNTVPMTLNKVAVKTDKIKIFPGSYAFSSGNPYISYGDSNLLLTSPSQYPSTSDLKPTLTKEGSKVFVDTAKSQVTACLKQKKLAPSGCPFALRELSGQKIDTDTISWKLSEDPFANLKPTLDYDNPAIAKASSSINLTFEAKGTSYGDRVTFGPQKVYGYASMTANLTQKPVKVAFTR